MAAPLSFTHRFEPAQREDIPPLVEHFVRKFALAMNKHITRILPTAMYQLQQQSWMGNVRELENAVERAMVVAQEPELREQDFIFKSQPSLAAAGKSLDEIERAHILRVLEECGGNQSRAADVLDIDRVTLHHKLKRYGWTRTRRKVGTDDLMSDRDRRRDEVGSNEHAAPASGR